MQLHPKMEVSTSLMFKSSCLQHAQRDGRYLFLLFAQQRGTRHINTKSKLKTNTSYAIKRKEEGWSKAYKIIYFSKIIFFTFHTIKKKRIKTKKITHLIKKNKNYASNTTEQQKLMFCLILFVTSKICTLICFFHCSLNFPNISTHFLSADAKVQHIRFDSVHEGAPQTIVHPSSSSSLSPFTFSAVVLTVFCSSEG